MKKIIALMLCTVMLIGVMSVAVFANDDFPNPWELEDFGQKFWTLYVNDKDAPVVDGKVSEGEYALVIDNLSTANNDSDDRFFVVDEPGDIVVDIYMDYDGDYLYVGVVIDDPEIVEGAPHGVDGRLRFDIGGDREKIGGDDMIRVRLEPGMMAAAGADRVATSVEGNVITYEFTVDRYTVLDKYGFDELEQVYIRYIICDETEESIANTALWNEMWFGFNSGDAGRVYPSGMTSAGRLPHVVYIVNEVAETEAPETEAPATQAPETEAPETEVPVTDAPVTESPETEALGEGGCSASAAVVGLVASLGACTAFISKKR